MQVTAVIIYFNIENANAMERVETFVFPDRWRVTVGINDSRSSLVYRAGPTLTKLATSIEAKATELIEGIAVWLTHAGSGDVLRIPGDEMLTILSMGSTISSNETTISELTLQREPADLIYIRNAVTRKTLPYSPMQDVKARKNKKSK